ncbi:uncharacterized protein E0L32_002545 [Thyridium curvatum]|uniref:NAD-dependent epimerase/dehydratase domain-containing protein n=1 Tax=Thyridium curvatum TaxID=1093900 RepID=A0A507BPG4_9PEZI|nr:uncharacterized protein E0L32_002545 [Thyridium curvatum]TPX18688.1 hypothetical protein E0L32_002545 [Thyridium curvatum]
MLVKASPRYSYLSMAHNILVTGAAGYVGGSVFADFLSREDGPVRTANIYGAVRAADQVQPVSKLGNSIRLDLSDEHTVMDTILNYQIDIVIHAASSIVTSLALNLIKALGKRREVSGQQTYFIHSSVITVFAEEAGWPYGEARDDGPLFTREKELAPEHHPVRTTNIAVIETAKELGVEAFNVPLPTVYGRGTGAVRKLSVRIPAYVRIGMKHRIIHKFPEDGNPPGIHIADLTELYAVIVEHILRQEKIPSGDKGYYFAIAHKVPWWRTIDLLAQQMHRRGLVNEPTPRTWPTYEMAADCLKFPARYVRAMGASTGDMIAINGPKLGWQPKWDQNRFLESLDQEIQDVLDLDTLQPFPAETPRAKMERIYESTKDLVLTNPLLYGGLAFLSWYAVSTFLTWYRLSHIPVASIFENLSKKYGPLVRIGPNDILTSDVELLRRSSAVRGTYDKSDWYYAIRWQPYTDNTVTIKEHGIHDRQKAKIAIAYNTSGREVDLIEPTVDEQVLEMIRLLDDKYAVEPGKASGQVPLLDFSNLSVYLTMDVITRAVFGEEFGHLKTDSDITGFLTAVREGWPRVSTVAEWPVLRRLLFSRTYLGLFGPKTTDKTGYGKLMSAVVDRVRERFEDPKSAKRKDMLSSWMQHGLNQLECESDGLLALVAGSETTASVMRITMLSLLSSPTAYRKLKETVKQAIDEHGVSQPITFAECKDIPYLRAVIYEGLRMRPGTPGQFPKIVPPAGETINGTYIPGGTSVGMNVPSILKLTGAFGSDVDTFRPERFLEVDEAQKVEMERTVEMMFGSGRWMCAGKPIAFMELYKTFFELFRNFDFQLANPGKPWSSRSYLVFVDDDYFLKVTKAEV